MKVEIKIIGSTEAVPWTVAKAVVAAASEAGMESGVATYSYGNKQNNQVEWRREPKPIIQRLLDEKGELGAEEVEVEQASVVEVKFASVIAARRAENYSLLPSAFEGIEPSGKRGYTVGDVESIAETTPSRISAGILAGIELHNTLHSV